MSKAGYEGMLKLIFSNLKERPTRTMVSVVAVGLGVALVLICVGLANGQLVDHASRVEKVGGHLMLQPPNSSHLLVMSSASMPVKLEQRILEIEGVDQVAPVLVHMDNFRQIFAVREDFASFSPHMKFREGRMFRDPYECVADEVFMNTNQLELGKSEDLLAKPFQVSGVYESGTAVRVMVPLQTAQELKGVGEKCSVFFIRLKDLAEIAEVEARLNEVFEGYTITRTSKLQELWTSRTPLYRPFLVTIVSIAVVVSFLIILLSMYSTITERTREIGILRSMGASKSYVIQLILRESLVVCCLGVALGFGLNVLGLYLVKLAFPQLPVETPMMWRIAAPSMAVLGGTVGSLYPAVKAARLDPVKALGYE